MDVMTPIPRIKTLTHSLRPIPPAVHKQASFDRILFPVLSILEVYFAQFPTTNWFHFDLIKPVTVNRWINCIIPLPKANWIYLLSTSNWCSISKVYKLMKSDKCVGDKAGKLWSVAMICAELREKSFVIWKLK